MLIDNAPLTRTILVAICLGLIGCSARQEASKPQPVRPEANIVDNAAMIGYFPPLYAGKSYAVSEGSTDQMGALHLSMARQNHDGAAISAAYDERGYIHWATPVPCKVIDQDASDNVYAATTCIVQKGEHSGETVYAIGLGAQPVR